MAIGTVKFFNFAKGFGFIIPEDGGKDVFVHKTAVELAGISALPKGQSLSFETECDENGAIHASQLKLVCNENLPPPQSKAPASNPAPRLRKPASRRPNRDAAQVGLLDQQALPHVSSVPPAKLGEWRKSYDRYCELAKNAESDQIAREHYWQHAEHFLRLINGSAR